MARISIDNGNTFLSAYEAIDSIISMGIWESIVEMMDDDIREKVHAELAPCTEEEFLRRYLEISNEDLIIG